MLGISILCSSRLSKKKSLQLSSKFRVLKYKWVLSVKAALSQPQKFLIILFNNLSLYKHKFVLVSLKLTKASASDFRVGFLSQLRILGTARTVGAMVGYSKLASRPLIIIEAPSMGLGRPLVGESRFPSRPLFLHTNPHL